jgi:hypothetical protein
VTTTAVHTAHSVIAAPTRHTVPSDATQLCAEFRARMWQANIDSWLKDGREYASVVAVHDDVRVVATWSTSWGSVEFVNVDASVQLRGPGHPASDFALTNPLFPWLSPSPSAMELGDAVRAAELSGGVVAQWAINAIEVAR